ncbi:MULTISPECIES: hypothetical protein [unclassified Spirosoma]|uniref:hypothetical protein n=1 Tax=unclassified Spirosoma TaxID=2621999 RepID=UPI00095AEAF5|nr:MULTISPECIES: hypothetical protein [unclassified Spirosoma]MBN8823738.1 hypothetical protein [Spirosoma sp.]OJW76716.1 MAG: hypothetical protein BGO59_20980 [Spirosoma sp. 48-14]
MKRWIITCLLLVSMCTVYGQTARPGSYPHAVIIPRTSTYVIPIVYQLHDGVGRLGDGSLLQGRFLYDKGTMFTFYQNGHTKGVKIPFFQFETLTLAGADTSVLPRSDSTMFSRIKNRLYRRLTIGKIALYDDVYAINENKGKIGDYLFVWGDNGKLKRLRNLEAINQWFYDTCQQNHWTNPDIFLSKTEIIKRLAVLDPTP